jgi:imidazoleglycerol phosphate synthase glutamine amidotransferase subunit HisH
MIVIFDYGVGNLKAIRNILGRAASRVLYRESPTNSVRPHSSFFRARGPILGICLGTQLFGGGSEEGDSACLNWVPDGDMFLRAERGFLSG